MNRGTRDVQVDAHPRVVSKYVACRPNSRHKTTDIEKGDLFDEVEERLKLCQGELNTTRRQVEVLQQKLVDTVEQRLVRAKFSPIKILSPVKELSISTIGSDERDESLTADFKEQLEELKKQNEDLAARLQESEFGRQNLISSQQQQIAHLVSEFDVVRKELDQASAFIKTASTH
ncbi:unnamed protein product [Gongylonema pulchrum]|uniref:Uncharacterized protein n=1 Tax=Gongylonema pulchrum TaxID=637853 RepID=A0A183DI01_9BILA|nr:unnamed protein product [Gongylonema pulchrum]